MEKAIVAYCSLIGFTWPDTFGMASGTHWSKLSWLNGHGNERSSESRDYCSSGLQLVNKCLEELNSQLIACNEKVAALERSAVETDVRLSELERNQHDIEEENKYLRLKVDQPENHSHKSNIRIIGTPKSAEAGNLIALTAKLLQDLFGEAIGSGPLIKCGSSYRPRQ